MPPAGQSKMRMVSIPESDDKAGFDGAVDSPTTIGGGHSGANVKMEDGGHGDVKMGDAEREGEESDGKNATNVELES